MKTIYYVISAKLDKNGQPVEHSEEVVGLLTDPKAIAAAQRIQKENHMFVHTSSILQ